MTDDIRLAVLAIDESKSTLLSISTGVAAQKRLNDLNLTTTHLQVQILMMFCFFFFNVIFINGFPSIHVNLHIRPQCRNLVWDVLTSYFPYIQAAMSKKKDHSTLWTIEVDDAVDDMNDLLREAENLDDQVCLQPVHRGLVACDILMLANNIHCIRVP